MSEWKHACFELPKLGSEVLVKCTGWEPKIASYIENKHCGHENDVKCGIWVIHDSRNVARIINAPLEMWAEIPKIPKPKKVTEI